MDDLDSRVDVKSQAFLIAVSEKGGRATTREIRKRTGLNGEERDYRFEKLEALGLIHTDKKTKNYRGPHPPKRASLTDCGLRYIEEVSLSEEAKEFLVESELTRRVQDIEEQVYQLQRENEEYDRRLSSLETWREKAKGMFNFVTQS